MAVSDRPIFVADLSLLALPLPLSIEELCPSLDDVGIVFSQVIYCLSSPPRLLPRTKERG